mmetsp:Transcript_3530/g.10267  ORF Transcript_3530/g.10267 Transcript_3530/m.10267 type:complete len:110 (-) Transcript_3530:39-368(-)
MQVDGKALDCGRHHCLAAPVALGMVGGLALASLGVASRGRPLRAASLAGRLGGRVAHSALPTSKHTFLLNQAVPVGARAASNPLGESVTPEQSPLWRLSLPRGSRDLIE